MKHYLEEYRYEGLTGNQYVPFFDTVKQKWCLINDWHEYTLVDLALLCDIPVDEVVLLTLRYGP